MGRLGAIFFKFIGGKTFTNGNVPVCTSKSSSPPIRINPAIFYICFQFIFRLFLGDPNNNKQGDGQKLRAQISTGHFGELFYVSSDKDETQQVLHNKND